MTSLVIDEVTSTDALLQEVTMIQHNRVRLSSIRLHLVGYNAPAGDLRLRILKDSVSKASSTLVISDIKAAIDTALGTSLAFWHGFVKFDFDPIVVLKEDDVIELELLGTNGYSFSESAYIGWRKEHEKLTNEVESGLILPHTFPFAYQFWGYKYE